MPTGLQVRAPGNRRSRVRLAPRKRSSVKCTAMPCRRTRENRGECRRDYSTQRDNLWGSSPHPACGHRCGRGSHSLFTLVAPALLEGSSFGRAAGFGPDGQGLEPFPSSQEHPGGMPGGLQIQTVAVCPIPCPPDSKYPGECRAALQVVPSWSRVRIPPRPPILWVRSSVDRARRVAKPLSPGPTM